MVSGVGLGRAFCAWPLFGACRAYFKVSPQVAFQAGGILIYSWRQPIRGGPPPLGLHHIHLGAQYSKLSKWLNIVGQQGNKVAGVHSGETNFSNCNTVMDGWMNT